MLLSLLTKLARPTILTVVGTIIGGKVVSNLKDSFVDNVIRDKVIPKPGSIVYCELAFGNAEHSGVYIDSDNIVHLDGSGAIEAVSPKTFLNRLGGFNSAVSIYVSCKDEFSVGNKSVADRALSMVGKSRKYNIIMDNCHQFTSGCISGNFENSDNFLWMLKDTASKDLGSNTWRVWEREF